MRGPGGPAWEPSDEAEYEGNEPVEAVIGQIDDRANHCCEALDGLPLGFRMTVLTAALNDTLEDASADDHLTVVSRILTLVPDYINSASEKHDDEFDEEFEDRLEDMAGLCLKFAEEIDDVVNDESFDEWGDRMDEEMTDLLDREEFDTDGSDPSE